MSDLKYRVEKNDLVIVKWLIWVGRSQVGKVIFLIIVNILAALTSILFAGFSKNIIDQATEYHSLSGVARYGLMLFALIMLQLVLRLINKSMSERTKGRLEMIFKERLLFEIMKKDYSAITAFHTGDLQNRIFNDVSVVIEGFVYILPETTNFISKLVFAFIYLTMLEKRLALIFFLGGIGIFFLSQMFRKTIKKLHKQVQETEGKTRSFIQETIINLLVVKAFGVEEKILKHTGNLQKENYAAKMKRRGFSIWANAAISTAFNVGYCLALVFGGVCLVNNTMTYGTVTAILQLVNQIQGPFSSLTGVMPMYFSVLASAERLMEIEALPAEEQVNKNKIDVPAVYENMDLIDFQNISFQYDRDIIFDHASLQVQKGDFVAIMGISGIGKSTLLKLLLGVYQVQEGAISIIGQDGKEIPCDKFTRKMFSYVPQGNMLLSGTIRENLTFINDEVTQEEIDDAIRISCAKQFIDEMPDGLDTIIGEKGMGLSEGQVQRLAIARSILSKSPVMLLDEATSALDEETEKEFLTNLRAINHVTCIIVSHKKAALEICNKHIQIVDGKIKVEE